MKVKVEAEHIDTATRKNSNQCMIADAIAKANPHAQYIKVDVQTIRWSDPRTGERYICLTPPKAQLNIIDWDQGQQIAPFQFNVQPIKVTKMGWQPKHPNSTRKGKRYLK